MIFFSESPEKGGIALGEWLEDYYQLNIKPGDVLKNPKYGRLRPGHFIIGGDGIDYVRGEAEKIIDRVRVVMEQEAK